MHIPSLTQGAATLLCVQNRSSRMCEPPLRSCTKTLHSVKKNCLTAYLRTFLLLVVAPALHP